MAMRASLIFRSIVPWLTRLLGLVTKVPGRVSCRCATWDDAR